MDVTESVDRAVSFMDDPSALGRQLTWWSNGGRGHWHADRECPKAQPDRFVRQRASILEAQGRLCRACFQKALSSLGVSRQWSASQQAARLSLLLDGVESDLEGELTSGEALLVAARLGELEAQVERCLESPSLRLRAFDDLALRSSAARGAVQVVMSPAREQSLRWAACTLVGETHSWRSDPLIDIMGKGSSGRPQLQEVFDAFTRSLVLHSSPARAVERARMVVGASRLADLRQLSGVPVSRARSGDLLSAAEARWREFVWDAASERLNGWVLAYRRILRRQQPHLVGVLALPKLGRVPAMVHAAVESHKVAPVGAARPGSLVLLCPEVVASALDLLGRGWHFDSVVDAGPCSDPSVAETAATLWTPLEDGPLSHLADALQAAEKLS